ncbi:MAG: CPBP family intramembrane metalloprotease [Bacillaceae bacterium]|nr:CPBP family intramembrane metalloprotease [Bacillaceae bacterium]
MRNKQAEAIKYMTDKELLGHLYFSQFLFFVIGVILAYFLFDSWDEFFAVWSFDLVHIFVIGTTFALVVYFADLFLMKNVPKHMFDDGGINEKMFQRRSVPHIFGLAFVIALVEEFLFRGVIQTHFGLITASIVFALMHIRYLSKWLLLLSVVFLSFLLGLIYEYTGSVLVTFWSHFLIDLLLALKIRHDYVNKYVHNDVEEDSDEE